MGSFAEKRVLPIYIIVPLFDKNTSFLRKFNLLLLSHFLTNHLNIFRRSYYIIKDTGPWFLWTFAISKTAKLAPKNRHFRLNQQKHIVYAGKLTSLELDTLALRALRALGLAFGSLLSGPSGPRGSDPRPRITAAGSLPAPWYKSYWTQVSVFHLTVSFSN